jgi:hypothetical protein
MGEVVQEIRNINAIVGANKNLHEFEITAKVLEPGK